MMEMEKLERAKLYIDMLANGIDPISGMPVSDGDVVNNVRVSRCLFYVADVLGRVIESERPKKKKEKQPFDIPLHQRNSFAYSDVPIAVSDITKRLNGLIDEERMKKITHRMINDWLVSVEMMHLVEMDDGAIRKLLTKQGEALGLTWERRMGMNGAYEVILFNREAQQFIVDNLDGITALEMVRQSTKQQARAERRENRGKPWSAEEEQRVRAMYHGGMTVRQIAAEVKRSSGAVRTRMQKLGLIES